MSSRHSNGIKWAKVGLLAIGIFVGVKVLFSIGRPNAVNTIAAALAGGLGGLFVFVLPMYLLGFALSRPFVSLTALATRRSSSSGVRAELSPRPGNHHDDQQAAQHQPVADLASEENQQLISNVPRREWRLQRSALLLSIALLAGVPAAVAALALIDRAVLIWIDVAAETKASEVRAQLQKSFDRLDASAQAVAREEAVTSCRITTTGYYDRELLCEPSDELVIKEWAAKQAVRLYDVEPCVYLYGAQTFRRSRAGIDSLCAALITVRGN